MYCRTEVLLPLVNPLFVTYSFIRKMPKNAWHVPIVREFVNFLLYFIRWVLNQNGNTIMAKDWKYTYITGTGANRDYTQKVYTIAKHQANIARL